MPAKPDRRRAKPTDAERLARELLTAKASITDVKGTEIYADAMRRALSGPDAPDVIDHLTSIACVAIEGVRRGGMTTSEAFAWLFERLDIVAHVLPALADQLDDAFDEDEAPRY
jgi:hypothetical protein